MKLSIITINYNNREGLRRTMESVFSQTCEDFEYIIIDGGSTDGSRDIIQKHKDHIDYWVSELDGRPLREAAIERMLKGLIDLDEVERWCGLLDQRPIY